MSDAYECKTCPTQYVNAQDAQVCDMAATLSCAEGSYYDYYSFFACDGWDNAENPVTECDSEKEFFVYYCEDWPCETGVDADGYCLDWCWYGANEAGDGCAAEPAADAWDMFTESAYKCIDPFLCAYEEPSDWSEAWVKYMDEDGRELKNWREGYFSLAGDMHAYCREWDSFKTEWRNFKIYDDQTEGVMDAGQSVANQDVTYLCWQGLVAECQPNADGEYLNQAGTSLNCVEGGPPTVNPTGWEIIDGFIAEPLLGFSAMYPDCTPNTPMAAVESRTDDEKALVDWLSFLEYAREPALWLSGYWDTDGSLLFWE